MFKAYFADRRWAAWAYGGGALLIISLIAQTYIALWLNDVFGATTDILANPDDYTVQQYYTEMWWWLLLSVVNDFLIVVPTSYFTRVYALRWRVAATEYYKPAWISTPQKIESAAQRIEEDLPNFINTTLMLVMGFLSAVITLFGFIPKLWHLSKGLDVGIPWGEHVYFLPKIPGLALWILLGVCVAFTAIVWLVGWWLAEIENDKRNANAALRKDLVITEDEIYPAIEHMRLTPFDHLFRVVATQMRFYRHMAAFELTTGIYSLVLEVLPYYIGVQSIFAGVITIGVVTKLVDAYGNVKSSFSFFVENRTTFAVLRAVRKRLKELEKNLGLRR